MSDNRILDILKPNYDPRVKVIKDISAGAVFIACIGTLIIRILIFWPHLNSLEIPDFFQKISRWNTTLLTKSLFFSII